MKYDLETINAALTALGADPIQDIDEDVENARRVKRVYLMLLKSTLRKHYWKFALKEASLSKLSTTPIFTEYADIYQLPADYIRLKKTSLDAPDFPGDYKIKGRAIYCNADTLDIEYVRFVDDPNDWDAEFKTAFAAEIASMLAFPVSTNATFSTTAKADAKDRLRQAKSSDSMEVNPEKPSRGSWVRGRG